MNSIDVSYQPKYTFFYFFVVSVPNISFSVFATYTEPTYETS